MTGFKLRSESMADVGHDSKLNKVARSVTAHKIGARLFYTCRVIIGVVHLLNVKPPRNPAEPKTHTTGAKHTKTTQYEQETATLSFVPCFVT
jgi:hypothetical protein